MRSHWREGFYPLQPVDGWGSLDAGREAGKEGDGDGNGKETEGGRGGGEGIVRIPDLDRPGTDHPRERRGCATLGLCLCSRDVFLLPRPPRGLRFRTAPGHRSKETVTELQRHRLVPCFLWFLGHPPTLAAEMVSLPNVRLATTDHHPPPLLSSHLSARRVSSAFVWCLIFQVRPPPPTPVPSLNENFHVEPTHLLLYPALLCRLLHIS